MKRPKPIEPTEHDIQRGIMQWAAMQEKFLPGLELLYAIPNGGHRDVRVAARMKAEGVKRGVPDLHLPIARKGAHGLWLEVKRGKQGRVMPQQRQWAENLVMNGHCVKIVRSVGEAIEVLRDYLILDERDDA